MSTRARPKTGGRHYRQADGSTITAAEHERQQTSPRRSRRATEPTPAAATDAGPAATKSETEDKS